MKYLFNFYKRYGYFILLMFLISGLLDLRIGVMAIICMVAPILVSFFKGRYWCGNLCPRGNFYDNIVSKFSNTKKVPNILKSKLFRVMVIIIMMIIFGAGIKANWGNLYGIGMVFYRMIVLTTIIGVGLSFFYNQRTWCHFCPMGTMASYVARLRKSKRVLRVSPSCVSCKICEKKCPLGLVPYDYKGDILSHPDCIQCGKCVNVCPKNAIGYDV
ncbi:4Fe-4S binding protein [Mobilisporobacter senegalensis]|uniref:4Fe-4S binding protein n=1 Tax=Mobilisporobacter senegalensis TaxID=1329262 RepID=A0A3N1XKK3_9FIRM|nr:4Fe-4S binding protein [Mobilisporobacter senegalensis]